MGTASYQSYIITSEDTIEQKQAKLYMAVCGMGDWLYQQGSSINEMNKEYLRWEAELDKYRQELRTIREMLNHIILLDKQIHSIE